MALADSLAAERATLPGPKCGVLRVRGALNASDAAVLDTALADDTVTNAQIVRALAREGHRVNPQTVSRHRQGRCGCGVG